MVGCGWLNIPRGGYVDRGDLRVLRCSGLESLSPGGPRDLCPARDTFRDGVGEAELALAGPISQGPANQSMGEDSAQHKYYVSD